jgi:hypothetical protein
MLTLYWGWRYVLVEAGPEQALTWRTGHLRGGLLGGLPDLFFPAARRPPRLAAIRGPSSFWLRHRSTRLEDGTFTEVWRWDSAKQMQGGLADRARFPRACALMLCDASRAAAGAAAASFVLW